MKFNVDTIEDFDRRVEPDTFVVLTIRQGICVAGGAFMPPSEEIIDRVVRVFLKKLAYALHGERRCKRQSIKIPNISTLEGRYGTLWHINICLRRPDDVSIDEFRAMVERVWSRSRWSRPNVYVEEIVGSALPYILKEGTDALLTGSTHF